MGHLIGMSLGSDRTSVINFYKGSVVLITGGTGFIGKVLIEKLLRCFEVKKIYLLVRERKQTSAADRLKEILQEPLFNVIRESNESVLSKVVAIDTNFQQDQIICESDYQMLLSEVTVILNVMASIKFNECIDTALDTNVICPRKLFDMATKMTELKSIVHVSTFYSNCDRSIIEEKVFDDIPFGGLDNLLEILGHLSDAEKSQLTPMILGRMPNSYVFSKKCAEVMIQQQFCKLPIVIFRPPAVSSALTEPIPGWVDNFNGLAGMTVAVDQGRVYRVYGNPSYRVHLAPVDYCVSALLAVGAEAERISTTAVPSKKVPVFNFASDANSLRWGEVGPRTAAGCQSRLGRFFGRYCIGLTTVYFVHLMFIWWFLLQAALADLLLVLLNKKRKHLDQVSRMIAFGKVTSFFVQHSWTTENENMRRLWLELDDNDRRVLQFDLETLNWDEYFRHYLPGLRAAIDRSRQRRKLKCT